MTVFTGVVVDFLKIAIGVPRKTCPEIRSRRTGSCERRIVQVEPVEDLIVIVTRGWRRVVGKCLAIRALK